MAQRPWARWRPQHGRPPWAWFDMNRHTDPLGLWFFGPATVVKRSFNLGEAFSTTYTKTPFWALSR